MEDERLTEEEEEDNYRCCCGSCHIKTGCWIMGTIGLVFTILGILGSIFALLEVDMIEQREEEQTISDSDSSEATTLEAEHVYLKYPLTMARIGFGVVANFVQAIAYIFLLVGLKKEAKGYLVPLLIVKMMCFVATVVYCSTLIAVTCIGGAHGFGYFIGFDEGQDVWFTRQGDVVLFMSVVLVCVHCVLVAAYLLWVFYLVRRTYYYFKEKEFLFQ